METLIPIFLAIAFFILQGYLGYKKEQEKAAKRNIGKPRAHPQPSPVQIPAPVPVSKPQVQTYIEPTYESFYKPEKYVPTERPENLLAEYKRLSTYDEDGVLKRAKKIRSEKRSEIKRLETQIHYEEENEKAANLIHFDLEQAIKIKAILDRPYQ